MNPQWHDEFVALCALYASGELTEEEWALLQVHLAYCEPCRVAFRDYQQITDEVMPVMAAVASSESEDRSEPSSASLEAAHRELMSQLDSLSTDQEKQSRRKLSWRIPVGLIAAGGVCMIGMHLVHSKSESHTQTPSVINVPQLASAAAANTAESELRPQLELAQSQLASLRQRFEAAKDQYRQSTSTVANIEQELAAEQEDRKKIVDQRDALNQQLAAAQADAQSMRDKSVETNATSVRQAARAASLEANLKSLNSALDEKDRMLALDKDLLAHDRDIRDLIGARDLYIADIYDVGQNGKTAKSFGRIFYTKDRSLVFYGYDLDKQPGLKQSVAFQAWGSGDDKQNVSLGLLYQDETHKRWVLSFNDTKTLARLNMVFVTAEPQGGSIKPTSKPLLLAYLQMQPNHP